MIYQAFGVSLLVGINIICQIVYQMLWAYFFGAGKEMDAFMVSLSLPTVLNAVIAGSLSYVLVPLLVKSQEIEERIQFLNITFNFLLFVGFILALPLLLKPNFIIKIIAPGLPLSIIKLASQLLRIQAIVLPLMLCLSCLISYYYATKRFFWPTFAPIVGIITSIIILLIFNKKFGIQILAWCSVINFFIQFIILFPEIMKNYTYKLNLHHPKLKQLIKSTIPLIAGNIYSKSDILVNNLIASFLPSGSISYLGYGQRIISSILRINVSGLAITNFPKMSENANIDLREFHSITITVIKYLFFILGLTVIIILVFGKLIIGFIFEHGAFNRVDTIKVTFTVWALLGVLVAGALGTILANCFYAFGDTKTPTLIGIVGYTLGIIFKIIGAKIYSYIGVALGMSLYYLFNLTLEIIILQKKKYFNFHLNFKNLFKVSIVILTTLVFGNFINDISSNKFFVFNLTFVVGIYLFMSHLMNLINIKTIISKIKF